MPETEQLIVELEARINKFEKSFERASRTADRRWKEIEGHGKRSTLAMEQGFARTSAVITRGANVATAALARLGGVIGVALSVREVLAAANAWQGFENKLKGAGVPAERVAATMERLTDLAQRSRSDIGSTVDLYSKLTMVSEQYGTTAEQNARITETVAKALKAAGASASEASSTVTQLSQALASGTLQGDELRALRENAPLLLKEIAKQIGVTTGQLKQMGADGKLTSDVLIRALLGASKTIDAAFAKTLPTASDGATKLKNSFVALVGELDKSTGSSKKLGSALSDIANAMDRARTAAPGWSASIAESAEQTIKKLGPLQKLLIWFGQVGRLDPDKVAEIDRRVRERQGRDQSELGRVMLKRGYSTPLSQNVDELYGGLDLTGKNVKAPPLDYSKKTGDLLKSITDRTEALRTEISTWGQSAFAVEKARVAQELLTAAKNAEVPVTASLRAKIDAASTAYAEQSARLEQLRAAYQNLQETRGLAQEFLTGFATDMAHGVSSVEAMSNALSRLQDRLIDLASSKLLDLAFGAARSAVQAAALAGCSDRCSRQRTLKADLSSALADRVTIVFSRGCPLASTSSTPTLRAVTGRSWMRSTAAAASRCRTLAVRSRFLRR